MRLNYPTNVKVLKVPCTGRVDVIHMLKALENGADGVYLAGCLEGECHYLVGNLRAKKRVGYAKQLLEECGIGGERVAMYNLSSAQGQRFAEIAREMTEKIRQLGPNPVKKGASSQGPGSGQDQSNEEPRVPGPGSSQKETSAVSGK
jgi:F420-non-reducing hydrogenase iron-sulfur subunit